MYGMEYYENHPSCNPSLGQDITKIHFRNKHLHAVCNSKTNKCSEHYDEYHLLKPLVTVMLLGSE